jgi:hypothetical protein
MNSPAFLRTVIAIGLPLAAIASIILAIMYVQDQQILRQGANEPQVWMAETIAARLSAGAPISAFIPTQPVVLETDQSPYIVVYDAAGKPIAGNATVGGVLPALPVGVFGAHKDGGDTNDNRITWQPAPSIRQAVVITPFESSTTRGYVLVGRSLHETQVREDVLTTRQFLGWAGTMIAVLIVSIIAAYLVRKREN